MELIRRSIAPGDSLLAEHSDPPRGYLFESGVAVGSVVLDRTPPTCIGLFSAGALIGLRTNAGPPAYSYRAVSSVDLLEVPPAFLQEGLQRRPALREAYLRQLHERSMQTALIAACNAHHSLATRCARWLLRLHAQLGPVIPVTHALLGTMLGVRRSGISVTLEALQRGGLIRQSRRSIEVLDEVALAAHACPCPNATSSPANAISVVLLGDDVADTERPRIWFERDISLQAAIAAPGDERWPRREAALRLCRTVAAQGLDALEKMHPDCLCGPA